MTTGVVLAGGVVTHQIVPAQLRCDDPSRLVVAADSGADLAEHLGMSIDLLIGDLDSVSAATLAEARRRGVTIRDFPTDKDATDLELAIEAVVEFGADELVILGGAGGRFDHLLANVAIIAQAATTHRFRTVEAWLGEAYVAVVRHAWRAQLDAGATLSVLPWAGDVVVSETGVRWPLDRRRIAVGSTLGVSNEALGGEVVITVDEGTALVICPDAKVLT